MEELVRQRVKEVLAFYGVSLTKLANGDSALQVKLSRQINRGAAVTFETISFILSNFSYVSAEWLMRGKGEMLISETPTVLSENQEKNQPLEKKSSLEKQISLLEKKIISLEAENNVLREVVGLQKREEQRKGEKIA